MSSTDRRQSRSLLLIRSGADEEIQKGGWRHRWAVAAIIAARLALTAGVRRQREQPTAVSGQGVMWVWREAVIRLPELGW